MMTDINITTSIAQIPNLQNVAGAQTAHPEAQQLLAAQIAQQSLKDEAKQVKKVEKQEGSAAIKDEEEQRGGQQHHESASRERRHSEDAGEDAPPASPSPWLGHLVNRKV